MIEHAASLGDSIEDARERILTRAQAMAEEVLLDEGKKFSLLQDIEVNRRLGQHGAAVIPEGANILHHCNTGALATVDIGTALGVIYGTCQKAIAMTE